MKRNLIVFDTDKFDVDLIRIINESNAFLISKSIAPDIVRQIAKTALNNSKFLNDK